MGFGKTNWTTLLGPLTRDATLDMLDAKALFELAGIAISRMLRDILLRSTQQVTATPSGIAGAS